MTTTTTARIPTEAGGAGLRAGEGIRHALMLVAMAPCVITTPAAAHAAALATLLVVAAWAAVRARHDERLLPALADAVAMVGAALVALLVQHGSEAAHGGHLGDGSPGGAMVIAGLVVAGWIGLRASTWRLAILTPRAKLRAVTAAAMLAVMLSLPALHGG